jgi:dTDP-4-amino-4,6-dideoxygalactose transaminase
MKIPSFNLTRQVEAIQEELNEAISRVMKSGQYILGPEVEAFENQAAEYLQAKRAIGVANGTDAIWLALKALGIGDGDIVITTPFTFFATAGAILNVGAKPVFADIDRNTFNLDPAAVRELLESDEEIRNSAKAILPVHLYGQPAEMDEFVALAEEFNLSIIEDNAQGIGAQYKGRMVGGIGHIGTISFFPTKNIGAFGDAGLVITQDDELAERVRKLRVQGSSAKYYHELVGVNSRLDSLQAAILSVKLKYLDSWIAARQEHARSYKELLGEMGGIETPSEAPNRTHIYHQYTIRVLDNRRAKLQEHLNEAGIGTAIHYPTPLHLQPAMSNFGYSDGDFPNAEAAAREVLSLPAFPELTAEERQVIVHSIAEFCNAKEVASA